jgi:hypothetical protein
MSAGKFFGGLLIVGGVLVALLCGLCTVLVIATSVDMPKDPQGYGGGGMIGIALLLGGVPTAFGCLMIWGGVVLVRAKPKPPAPPVTPETLE